MKSYKEFSEEAEQLDEILGPAIRRGGKLLRGGAKAAGKLGGTALGVAGTAAGLGGKALMGAGGLAANVIKSLLDGDKDDGGEKVSKSTPLKSVEKHT
jgi:hypothetical protein